RDLPHRQRAVPEGEILLPVAAHDLHGVLAAGLLWPVRPGDQEPGAGVLLWGADERAEGGGDVAEGGGTDLRRTDGEPPDQRPRRIPRRERRTLRGGAGQQSVAASGGKAHT